MKWLLIILYAAKLADLSTTEMVLSQGGYEANPFQKNAIARYTITIVAPYVIYRITENRSKKVRIITAIAVSAWWSTVAALNYRNYHRMRRFEFQFGVSWN